MVVELVLLSESTERPWAAPEPLLKPSRLLPTEFQYVSITEEPPVRLSWPAMTMLRELDISTRR